MAEMRCTLLWTKLFPFYWLVAAAVAFLRTEEGSVDHLIQRSVYRSTLITIVRSVSSYISPRHCEFPIESLSFTSDS